MFQRENLPSTNFFFPLPNCYKSFSSRVFIGSITLPDASIMMSCTTNEVGTSSTWVRMLFAIVLWPCNTSCAIAGFGGKQGKERGGRRICNQGGKASTGHHARVAYTWSHGSIYVFICKSVYAYVRERARRLPGKWMCWPHQRVSSWWRGFGSGALAATRSGGSLHLCCLGTGLDCGCGGWSVCELLCVRVCMCVCVCAGVCVLKALGHPFHLLTTFHLTPHTCSHRYTQPVASKLHF